ncbi:helix-turn-helix domain-containing protein [Streptomyces uncialis]|uniref:helix-turn-helix domain-containing protein n=1 Tax=Streptomyces uncialis TaxID=1048205 RepID=UPI0038708B21|nr:helix-turn-helix domain-containing protein [Streptomyces uncialis]
MAETLGDVLVRLRRKRGWTQQQVADAYCNATGSVTKDAREVGRWERGTRIPVPFARCHLAAVFGVPVGLLDRAAAHSRSARDQAQEALPQRDSDALTLNPADMGAIHTALTGGLVRKPPRHVDPALIPYFQAQLLGHYEADMMLGPLSLLDTVEAQCRLIGNLIDQADGSTRRLLAEVGVSYATFAAWLHLDAGHPATALPWHDVAQEMAHRSHNHEAVACALVDRAMARTDQGSGAAVIDLCDAALMDDAHLSAEVLVFALQQKAHGASLIGSRKEVDELLDRASRAIGQVDAEIWGTACLRTPNYVEVQRATCYGRLGLAAEANELWEQIIPIAPSKSRRDTAVWSARQAVASAALRDPERAVDLARHAAKVALETGSARTVRELSSVATAMRPWQAERIGQDLAEVLAPIGRGAPHG